MFPSLVPSAMDCPATGRQGGGASRFRAHFSHDVLSKMDNAGTGLQCGSTQKRTDQAPERLPCFWLPGFPFRVRTYSKQIAPHIFAIKFKTGMRLIRDEERAFFRLAVEEWSNEFGLPSKHPLFFRWVQDPVSHINSLHSQMDSQEWTSIGISIIHYEHSSPTTVMS